MSHKNQEAWAKFWCKYLRKFAVGCFILGFIFNNLQQIFVCCHIVEASQSALSSFTWHPTQENHLLTISPSGNSFSYQLNTDGSVTQQVSFLQAKLLIFQSLSFLTPGISWAYCFIQDF